MIAAGIAAMTLAYGAALPSLLNFNGCEKVCANLHMKNAMEKMLHAMSVMTGYQQHFYQPNKILGRKGTFGCLYFRLQCARLIK
jgi:hypothetical protein